MNPYLTNADLMKGEDHMNKKMDKIIKEVMAAMGRRGRGASKVRGNKKYYQNLVKIREVKKHASPSTLAKPLK